MPAKGLVLLAHHGPYYHLFKDLIPSVSLDINTLFYEPRLTGRPSATYIYLYDRKHKLTAATISNSS